MPAPAPTIFTKTGDASAALEVDHIILDYLSHQATNAVLESRKSRDMGSSNLKRKLAAFDAFMEMFKAKHPHYTPDPELRFRLLLLRFATLFCGRLVRSKATPSKQALTQLREANNTRARDWIRDSNGLPSGAHDMSLFDHIGISLSQLETNRVHNLRALEMAPEDDAYDDAFYGTSSSVSLLDLLPSFMAVIAARNELNNSNISRGLMVLAVEFMVQSCLEQYLIRGNSGSDAIDEAFAWGYKPTHPTNDDQDTTGDETSRMFLSDEEGESQEVPEWSALKSEHVSLLAVNVGDTLEGHLTWLAGQLDVCSLEDSVVKLLVGLAASLPLPILTQLEGGTLDGMSRAETKAFLRSCGLDEGWPMVLD